MLNSIQRIHRLSQQGDKMNAKQVITDLQKLSQTLSETANAPENYNTDWAQYLENMSFELFKHANEIRDLEYQFGISNPKNILRA